MNAHIAARRRQHGLTLVEVVLFIVIVSLGLAGVLSVFNITTARSADPMVRKQLITVAETMMEEVLLKDFANPAGGFTPAAAGNPTQLERASFDDVGDYNMTGANRWTGVRGINDVATDIPGLEAYTVAIAVAASAALAGIAAADALQVTVTVTNGGAETVTLVGFRANYD